MKRYINFLKKILILRRIKDGLFATRYFNKKYLQIIKWMFTSKEDTNFTYDLEDKNLNELYKLLESIFDKKFEEILCYLEKSQRITGILVLALGYHI